MEGQIEEMRRGKETRRGRRRGGRERIRGRKKRRWGWETVLRSPCHTEFYM